MEMQKMKVMTLVQIVLSLEGFVKNLNLNFEDMLMMNIIMAYGLGLLMQPCRLLISFIHVLWTDGRELRIVRLGNLHNRKWKEGRERQLFASATSTSICV